MSREQKLVNAQVEVNRAVFLMNYKDEDGHMDPEATSDESICRHIESAIESLKAARHGYLVQRELAL